MVALPQRQFQSGEPEMASQAAVSGLTKVVPCVTARCACNRHPARERRQDDARLSCCCRNGFWSGRRVGRFGAVRRLTARRDARSARVHVVKGHVARSA